MVWTVLLANCNRAATVRMSYRQLSLELELKRLLPALVLRFGSIFADCCGAMAVVAPLHPHRRTEAVSVYPSRENQRSMPKVWKDLTDSGQLALFPGAKDVNERQQSGSGNGVTQLEGWSRACSTARCA